MDDDPEFNEIVTTKLEQVSIPALSVVVDFNALMTDSGFSEALNIIGQLKDLLAAT